MIKNIKDSHKKSDLYNGCDYYHGELGCMVGEADIPSELLKKCQETKEKKHD